MRTFVTAGLAAILSCTVAWSPAAAEENGSAALLGTLFCQLRGEGEPVLRYLVTRSLSEAIDKALAKNDAIAAAHPEEKPPLGDGVPFQAYPDHAPVCRIKAVAPLEGGIGVEIEHQFPDQPSASWTDRLVVKTEEGLAKIDDILYGPEKFETGLRGALATVFRRG